MVSGPQSAQAGPDGRGSDAASLRTTRRFKRETMLFLFLPTKTIGPHNIHKRSKMSDQCGVLWTFGSGLESQAYGRSYHSIFSFFNWLSLVGLLIKDYFFIF